MNRQGGSGRRAGRCLAVGSWSCTLCTRRSQHVFRPANDFPRSRSGRPKKAIISRWVCASDSTTPSDSATFGGFEGWGFFDNFGVAPSKTLMPHFDVKMVISALKTAAFSPAAPKIPAHCAEASGRPGHDTCQVLIGERS